MTNRKQLRIRGFVKDDNGGTPGIFVLTIEGTEDEITVGDDDILYIDGYSCGGQSGFTTLFFSDDGVDDEDLAKIAQFVGFQTHTFPRPVHGRPGDNAYLGSSGANRVDGTITGWLYQA